MHNIIKFPIISRDAEGKSMTKFASKRKSGQSQLHLTYNWNMNTFTTPKGFIVRSKAHKLLTIMLHTIKKTRAMSLPEAQPIIIFNINGDHFTPSMAIILFVHALDFGRTMSMGSKGGNSN
jgi:hypothetical protein